jgi:hypothetical protein
MHHRTEEIRVFRNRIAHHEPLLTTNLAGLHQNALTLLSIISPVLARDVAATSLVPGLLQNRP